MDWINYFTYMVQGAIAIVVITILFFVISAVFFGAIRGMALMNLKNERERKAKAAKNAGGMIDLTRLDRAEGTGIYGTDSRKN